MKRLDIAMKHSENLHVLALSVLTVRQIISISR